MQTAGILLTGGASRRLGFDKATAIRAGEALAARAARVLSLACAPVVEVGPGVSGLPSVRENPPGSGPLAAVVAGADALGADRVIVLAVDLVNVGAPLLDLLVRWPGDATVVPTSDGRAQYVCARYGPVALREGRRRLANGERSLRWVHDLDADALVTIGEAQWRTAAGPDVFRDLDTPDDAVALGIVEGPTSSPRS